MFRRSGRNCGRTEARKINGEEKLYDRKRRREGREREKERKNHTVGADRIEFVICKIVFCFRKKIIIRNQNGEKKTGA